MKYFPRVLPYLKPYWRLACLSVVLIFLGAALGLLVPWPLKILVDHVLGQKPMPTYLDWFLQPLANNRGMLLLVVAAGGLGITLLQNAVTVLHEYASTKVDQAMVLDFRSDLMQHAQRLSLAFHNERRTGKVIFAINNMGGTIAKLVMVIPPLAESGLTLIGMLVILLFLDWQLALISLAIVPFLYYSVGHYMKRIHPRLKRVRGMEAELLSKIHETISMMPVVMAFGREDHEHRLYREHGEKTVDERVGLTIRQTVFSLGVNTITAVGTALVLGFGGWSVLQGDLTVGELLVVMSYVAAVYKPLETISSTMASLQEITVGLDAAFGLMDTKVDVKDSPGAKPLEHCHGRIAFRNVGFTYKERHSTLEDISFEVQPGQVVGIVGPTGAGKTTLVSLMPRFYDPQQGRILIDGEDTRDIKLRSLRDQFSIVLQEPLLFSGTIEENIRYGRLDASQEEIIAAAEAANAHDFIARLPKKYKTVLGERGAKLSGGERQRISVARAFLKDAPFLILDEPTSSIDTRTESVILEALRRLMEGRTTFMIAHRLSTVCDADLLLVLHDGRIVQRGIHEELIEQDGLYRQLYEMQSRQTRLAAVLPEANGWPNRAPLGVAPEASR
jgi:ATP-binding cassette subfamily B protein/subfamily B ATP-binding cassette protein MsbA